MTRIKINKFMKACKESGGIISIIAKRLNCSRQAIYDFLKREPPMEKYIEAARNDLLDLAEDKIIQSIKLAQPIGAMEDVKWFLSRLGKIRGYSDKPEIQINQIDKQSNVQINIENVRELIKKNEDIWN